MKKFSLAWVVGLAAILMSGNAMAGKDLDAIKARGSLICGVPTGTAGFALADSQGKWVGLDVDVCRAVAAAIFGDAEKVKYTPLTAQQRFTALQSGEVDMLSNNTTATLTRDTALGLDFTAVTFYDGQGFMVNKKLGVKSAKELNGDHYEVLSPAADALAGKHPLAATLLLRAMIDFALKQSRGETISARRPPSRGICEPRKQYQRLWRL